MTEPSATTPNIATLQFGAGLTAISDNAFATNNAIESLTIPKTIATIGAGSFANWSKLTKLTISGNTLTSIGSKAFENAALLAERLCGTDDGPCGTGRQFLRRGYFGPRLPKRST